MRLAAFDPGGTTGVAIIDLDSSQLVWCGQFKTPPYQSLVDHVSHAGIIVCESFAGNTANPDHQATVRLIGFLEGLCELRGLPFVLQVPSTRYPFRETARRMLTEYHVHAADALAHGLAYMNLRKLQHSPSTDVPPAQL